MDAEVGEQQPLLRRASTSRLQERQQFQQSQRQAVVGVATSGQGIVARMFLCFFWLGVFSVAALWCYLYFGSLWVIVFHLDRPCDQPLGLWLVIWMILPTFHAIFDPPPPRELGYDEERNRHNARSGFIHTVWFGVGCFWYHSAKTCQFTNAKLFLWVKFVIHIYLFGVFMFLVFPLMLAFFCLQAFRLYHALIDRGWISNPRAASAETLENLEVVPYDPSLFASEDNISDKRPSGECCCCQDNFGPDIPIVRTPCGHYYHKPCLGEWLKLAKTCPLCRTNLDEGRPDDQVECAPADQDPPDTALEGDAELARQLQEEELQAAVGLRVT